MNFNPYLCVLGFKLVAIFSDLIQFYNTEDEINLEHLQMLFLERRSSSITNSSINYL